jgi:hypothetical protein
MKNLNPKKAGRKKLFKSKNKFILLQISNVQFIYLTKLLKNFNMVDEEGENKKKSTMQDYLRYLIFNHPLTIKQKEQVF